MLPLEVIINPPWFIFGIVFNLVWIFDVCAFVVAVVEFVVVAFDCWDKTFNLFWNIKLFDVFEFGVLANNIFELLLLLLLLTKSTLNKSLLLRSFFWLNEKNTITLNIYGFEVEVALIMQIRKTRQTGNVV